MTSAAAPPLVPPPRLERRRADGRMSRVTRDRLTSMAVLAALLHGLIILGITFAPPPMSDSGTDHGIEVLLVSDELPEETSNDAAVYLSQRTQTGSGNTGERLPAQVPEPGRPGTRPSA